MKKKFFIGIGAIVLLALVFTPAITQRLVLLRDFHPSVLLAFRDTVRTAVGDSVAALSIDGFSLFVNADNQIAQKVYADTTALKAASGDSLGSFVNLKQLSSSNTNGGGIFVYADSAYPESGIFAFNSSTQGKQWVRQDLLGKRPYYAIDYGVVPNDSTYSASNTDIINALCLEAYTGANAYTKTGAVIIPAGDIWIEKTPGTNYCINFKFAASFLGSGVSPQTNGTMFKVRANQVSPGDTLVALVNGVAGAYWDGDANWPNYWWHWSTAGNFYVNCNGNKQSGVIAGVDLFTPGETASFHNVQIGGFVGWGLRVFGSTAPSASLYDITSNPATSADTTGTYAASERKSFWVGEGAGINGRNLSGDYGRPLLYVGSGGNGETTAKVLINHLKFETGNTSTPGWSVSLPLVVDTVDYIGSSIEIHQLTANGGQNETGRQENMIVINGVNSTDMPAVDITISASTGWDNLMYWTIGGVSDSTKSSVTSEGSANQLASKISWGSSNYYYQQEKIIKPYPAYGFFYENHLDTLIQSLYYNTDQKFHIVSPRNSILFENWQGNDLAELTNTAFTINRITYLGASLKIGGSTSAFATIDSAKIENGLLKFWIGGVKYSAIHEDSLVNFRN